MAAADEELEAELKEKLAAVGARLSELGLEDFVAAEDREAVLRVEHDIAAVAGHIGLSALSLAAAGANREGRRDTARSARALAQPVLDLGPGSLAALRDLLDGEPPASAGPGAGDQGGLGTRPLPD